MLIWESESVNIQSWWSLFCSDVIWVILSVEVGGLLGVTQQLSSFQAEFNTQPHRPLEGDYNPFASPEKSKCPNSNSLHDASGHMVQEEHWQRSPSELQQDQNGLSHNSVDIVASSLQTNLSLVSYNKVSHIKGNFPTSYLFIYLIQTAFYSILPEFFTKTCFTLSAFFGNSSNFSNSQLLSKDELFQKTKKQHVESKITLFLCCIPVVQTLYVIMSPSSQGIKEPYPFGNS